MLASDSACPQLASPGERARRTLHSHSMQKLRIDVWSDIACPWCYVGKRRLEAALAQFPHRARGRGRLARVRARPSAPPVRDERSSRTPSGSPKKYGTTSSRPTR